MNKKVIKRKAIEKLGFNCFEEGKYGECLIGTNYINPKTKSERTEGQHKKKGCCCGWHSIQGYKEKTKFPKWKKKSRKEKEGC